MRFIRWVALVAVLACFPAFGADQEPSPKGPDGLTLMVTATWLCGQAGDVETMVKAGGFRRIMTGTGDDGRPLALYVSEKAGRWFFAVPFGKLICVTNAGDDPLLTIGEPA